MTDKTLDERLKEAEERAKLIDDESHLREEDARKLARIEEIEMRERDMPMVRKAEDEIGPQGSKIAVVWTRLGAIIVRRPPPMIWKKFQDSGKQDTRSLDDLVRGSLVYPDKLQFSKIMDEQPGALVLVADECALLAGVRVKDAAGK